MNQKNRLYFSFLMERRSCGLQKAAFTLLLLLCYNIGLAQSPAISFTVSMPHPSTHTFHVQMEYAKSHQKSINFQLPVWTPGYYQKLNFAKNIENFQATDENGRALHAQKTNDYTWRVSTANANTVGLSYDVKTSRQFVATPYLDKEHGYIIPAALFFHPADGIQSPVKITIKPFDGWHDVATGLDRVDKQPFTFRADNYDKLYDSPLLIGNLQHLPSFTVKGIPHYFVGYKMGDFDKQVFMQDLKKIVEAATSIMGDIPYKHYTFLGIGPGAGGIEHLNSATVSFTDDGLDSHKTRLKTLFFLAHEYFHNYNVKRIRPIELGPFDYEHANHTKLLWIAEGLTVYYEYLTVERAGLCSEDELLQAFHENMIAYERNPGRFFQTLEEASYQTWNDGPFGRTGGSVNKTISYYNKGPLVGMMLNFKIQHATHNAKSLDDVMRALYQKFYQKKKRGFTQAEFRGVAEQVAQTSLHDIFEYISTTKSLDYNHYLNYAGYKVDTTSQIVAGGWLGITTRVRDKRSVISHVDWKSPAWQAGLRPQDIILKVNDKSADSFQFEPVLSSENPGDHLSVTFLHGSKKKKINLVLTTKKEKSFLISKIASPTEQQRQIREKWIKPVDASVGKNK